eukprot:5077905-Ditylum_brightwellii.AAC.1
MSEYLHFSKVKDFLTIEDPILQMKHQAATFSVTRSNESSESVPKRISTRRWNIIKFFHIIEPAHMQLYVAINLCVPHYQVPATMAKQYFQCLQ